jgi:hypothetical protein
MTETTSTTTWATEKELALIYEGLSDLEAKMKAGGVTEGEISEIKNRVLALRPDRAIWTTDGEVPNEVMVPLGVKSGRAVFFDTGEGGVIEAYIDHGFLVVCNGEGGFNVVVRPVSENEINITTEPLTVRA